MRDQKIGHCLPLYLQNKTLLSALVDEDALPADAGDDRKLLAEFRERASEQAASILEELFVCLFSSAATTASVVPYRYDRSTQRRTVRQHWYMEGRLLRKHEKVGRAYWNLYLGCLRDKGPAATLVVGPWQDGAHAAFDALAPTVSPLVGLDSANARTAFAHETAYESGVIAAFVLLGPGTLYSQLQEGIQKRAADFFYKFRSDVDAALDD